VDGMRQPGSSRFRRKHRPGRCYFAGLASLLLYPGEYPFTRGVQPTMYRGRLWTMRQYAGMGDAEESNKRYKYLLANGTTGLSVAFDLPTQIGYGFGSCAGGWAKWERWEWRSIPSKTWSGCSTAFRSDEDFDFDDHQCDGVDSAGAVCCGGAAAGRGRPQAFGHGAERYAEGIHRARNVYLSGAQAMRIITDMFAWTQRNVPEWNTISISGYHMREAGSTAVQEVAFTLANGMAYVRRRSTRGLDVDKFAPRLSFFFNAHNNLLEEVAKFRAARRMWARIMRERFGAKNPRSWMLRFHTQTAGSTLTAQQPENNIVRTAMQALAAVLGGTQSLHTNSVRRSAGACPRNRRRGLRCGRSRSSRMSPAWRRR
jgi:methylmalonyl-CoA mutase, N-terminal domain